MRIATWPARQLRTDANDLIFYFNASRNYDPSPRLESIAAPLLWINSADDFINPPELGIAEKMVKRIPKGHFVLLPVSDATRGHGTPHRRGGLEGPPGRVHARHRTQAVDKSSREALA